MVATQSDTVTDTPFWQTLSLSEMSAEQWDALCDGCARCCLNKIEYEDTGEIEWTEVVCRLLDDESCRCKDYPNRHEKVPECIALTPKNVGTLAWLPPPCAYRLLDEGRDLYWWHPLVSGDPESIHFAGISVRGRTLSEEDVRAEDYEDHIVAWPNQDPYAVRRDATE